MVQQYLDHAKAILTSKYSGFKMGSKGSGLISLFGYQNQYDLREGFPLLTTKKMATRSIIHELIWFMRGDTNIKYLEDNDVTIWRGNTFEYNLPKMQKEGIFKKDIIKYSADWDKAMKEYAQRIKESEEFAKRFGDAGPIYGKQWRQSPYYEEEKGELTHIDQLGNFITGLKKKPQSKRHLVVAWNPGDVPKMSLPPCHVLYQSGVDEDGHFDLQLYQRSSDEFLGVPFNIASYVMLTHIIAQETGLTARRFIHTFGDAHFYTGLEKRSRWYDDNLGTLRKKIKGVKQREEYLDVLEWINKHAPKDADFPNDPKEEKYDQVTAILEQMSREPKPLPQLEIAKKPFEELTIDDFKLINYDFHPAIKRAMAV